MITGPGWIGLCVAVLSQATHNIPIGIENADRWNFATRKPLLAACFPQEVRRCECRGLAIVLAGQDGG